MIAPLTARRVSRTFFATLTAIALALLAIVTQFPGVAPAMASPRAAELVNADLLLEPSAIQPGQPFMVALRLRMKPHWHTYWRNPGDSGLPTEIRWMLPAGFTAGPIQWPTPERLPVGPLMNFGYEGEAILLTEITPPANLAPVGRITIKADASWLVCEKECIPGGASLTASAPAAPATTSVPPSPSAATIFAAARARLPTPLDGATLASDDRMLTITAPVPSGAKAETITSAAFFPVEEALLENAAQQTFSIADGQISVISERSATMSTAPRHLEGVIALTSADKITRGYAVSIGDPPAATSASASPVHPAMRLADTPTVLATASAAAVVASAGSEHVTLFTAIILAFAGGIILNLMPCVFPVLSIKVLSLARGAGKAPGAMRLHGLSYGAGVLFSFAALAAVLMTARQAGASIGWGFQLQSPLVVALLAYVMFIMGLGLSGAIQIGAAFSGVGDRLTRSSGYAGSFFTGVLASVVASPCTGPFMGAAIGFSLTQPPLITMAVFVALGAGLAFPFVLLAFLPALVRRMPKPGRWMEILKQALAFPLYATAAWLIWVLSQQVSSLGLGLVLAGMVAVALAVWSSGLAIGASRGGAIAVRIVAVVAIIIAAMCVWRVEQFQTPHGAVAAVQEGVEPFSQQRLDALLHEGRPVFVNMTAAWCITCMVNERTTLDTTAVKQALHARGVVYMKGDWTNQNPEITQLLARFGRGGVPLYLLYRGDGANEQPVILPQILTPAVVTDALAALPLRTAGKRDDTPG